MTQWREEEDNNNNKNNRNKKIVRTALPWIAGRTVRCIVRVCFSIRPSCRFIMPHPSPLDYLWCCISMSYTHPSPRRRCFPFWKRISQPPTPKTRPLLSFLHPKMGVGKKAAVVEAGPVLGMSSRPPRRHGGRQIMSGALLWGTWRLRRSYRLSQ